MVVPIAAAITQAPARTAEPKQSGNANSGGSRPANGGNIQPPEATGLPDRRQADSAASIAETAARLQELVRESGRALEFRVDDYSGRTVITVTNEATGEVVRQIPSEELLALSRSLGRFGAFLDFEA